MESYEYTVILARQKHRNQREVRALLKAVAAKGSPLQSLLLCVDSPKGLDSQQKLLESPQMLNLERLALSLDFGLGANSLAILGRVIETEKLPRLQRLSISYRDGDLDEHHIHSRMASHTFGSCTPGAVPSQSTSSILSSFFGSSSGSVNGHGSPFLQSSSISSSLSPLGGGTSSSQHGNNSLHSPAAPVSWDGFALLARALKKNLLPCMNPEKTISFHSNWASRNLGDSGVKHLAELIETGYLSSLKDLNLEDNSIGDEGMEALAAAFRTGNTPLLETLNLNRNFQQDSSSASGVLHVVKAVEANHLPALQRLKLFGAGQKEITSTDNKFSVANEIIESFIRNTALTAAVELDWPDKRFQDRWNVVVQRNVKLARKLEKLEKEDEVPVTDAKIFVCGSPGVGKTTLCSSLKRSRCKSFFKKELKPHVEKATRGIELTKIRERGNYGAAKVSLTLWDLAGHEDFQLLHNAFLPDLGIANGKATTFLVVFNAKYDRSPATGSASREEELGYWLRFIAFYSIIGVKRRVLVVLNTFNPAACVVKGQWTELLRRTREKYQDVLDINPNPFVVDARVAKSVKSLKRELFQCTGSALKGVRWPKFCRYIQENLEAWSLENQNFPMMSWSDLVGKMAASKILPEQLEAAVEYLHETGDLIYFRRGSPSEGRSVYPEARLIVLDPEWFCKRVVGQLLLPEEMLDERESLLKRSVASGGSISVSKIKAYFNDHGLLTTDRQVDYVLNMLYQLGLCYEVDPDKVLIPALIETDQLPSMIWSRNPSLCSSLWVMGRSLAVKHSEKTAFPKSVFSRLQVQLARDPVLGAANNSDYMVGKFYLSFKNCGTAILVQYNIDGGGGPSGDDDRIDVVSKPLESSTDTNFMTTRTAQIQLVSKVIARLQQLCLEWCPGLRFVEKVVLPWRASEGALPMPERNAKLSVEALKKSLQLQVWPTSTGPKLQLESGWSDLNWYVGDEVVKEHDLLSNGELNESCSSRVEQPAFALSSKMVPQNSLQLRDSGSASSALTEDERASPATKLTLSNFSPEPKSFKARFNASNRRTSSGFKPPVISLHLKSEGESMSYRLESRAQGCGSVTVSGHLGLNTRRQTTSELQETVGTGV